ncbi:MAG: autotransporter-associated beta strand repeat-containing protein, partial [Candidatus Firestonebacteria bacterium]
LTQSGPGTLVLDGANSYNGDTTLNGGTLTAGNATAFGNGTGTIIINGGTLDSSVASLVLTGNKNQVWNGNFAFTGSKKNNPHLLRFEYALMFLLILFISPASWLNHFVTVFLAYYVAANYMRDESKSPLGRTLMKIGFITCFSLAALSSFNRYAQSYSGMFLGHFILMITMFTVLFIEKSRSRKKWQHI